MRVTPLGVRLGRLLAPAEGAGCLVARTMLRIANVSEQMPLQWSALAPVGVDLDRTHGELPGYGAGGSSGGGAGGSSGGGGGGSGSRSVRSVRSSSGGSGGGEGDKMKRLQKALDRIRQLVSSRKFVGARHGADGGERVDESQAEVGAVSSAELDEEVTRGLLRAEVGADAIEDPWSVFVAKQSADCEATCAASGKRCSEEGLRAINVCSELEKYLKCQGCEVSFGADQPALVSEDAPAESKPRMCLVNTEAPTCLGFHKLTTRLCACAAVRD